MLRVKYIMHLCYTVWIHLYCFVILPNRTQTHFLSNVRLIIFYLLWMVYLWLSVLQIRKGFESRRRLTCSYPTKDQYIQKVVAADYSMKAYMFNTIYRSIPFLYELNCLIDWSVTDTATDLWGYMRVEEIRNILFIDKYKVVVSLVSER